MLEEFKKAKSKKEVILYKNFQQPEITWEDVLKYVYKLSKIPNPNMLVRVEKSGGYPMGSLIDNRGYFLFDDNFLFTEFKGIEELMQKINNNKTDKNCIAYKNESQGKCNCEATWHIQALRFSMMDHFVSNHNDPNDVLYWQVLGTSYWKINKDKIYKLEPGDLFYFNQEDSHEVWQDEPRAGIIIDSKYRH